MFQIADVNAPRMLLHCLLPFVCFTSASVLHAAQPLSDQELKNRYLSYGEAYSQPVVLAQPVTMAAPQEFMPRTFRLIDIENTNNLLRWQDNKNLAVGASVGLQDSSLQLLAAQPAANFGSEPFSLRWSGNLDQVTEVIRISGFALYGVDVDLYNISGEVTVDTRVF